MLSILSNKWVLYALAGVFALSIISNIVDNIKEMRKEPTFTKEAVEVMLKHQKLKIEIEEHKLQIEILQKDYERITQQIDKDSTIIFNSSRQYRDSLRAALFHH